MKNSADENAVSVRLIEDNMLTHFEATKTRTERITRTPHAWLLSNQIKAIQQQAKIAFRLRVAPVVSRVESNLG